MKKITFLFFIIFNLSACQLVQNYDMISSFTNEIKTETKVESKSNGLLLEIPFADFSCDISSFKSKLNREGDVFTLMISGQESTKRCSQLFSANIEGIEQGDYWLKVIYNKNGDQQEVLYQEFSIN